jgi:hypothetical protein
MSPHEGNEYDEMISPKVSCTRSPLVEGTLEYFIFTLYIVPEENSRTVS